MLQETGHQTYSYTIPVAGTYTLGFGIVDVGDDTVNSALLLHKVKFQAVPESMSYTGVAAAMAFAAWFQIKRRRRFNQGQN